MKVGDLVRLSNYGRERTRAKWIGRDDVGIIVQVVHHDRYPSEFKVRWCNSSIKDRNGTHSYDYWKWERSSHRKDLKYAK